MSLGLHSPAAARTHPNMLPSRHAHALEWLLEPASSAQRRKRLFGRGRRLVYPHTHAHSSPLALMLCMPSACAMLLAGCATDLILMLLPLLPADAYRPIVRLLQRTARVHLNRLGHWLVRRSVGCAGSAAFRHRRFCRRISTSRALARLASAPARFRCWRGLCTFVRVRILVVVVVVAVAVAAECAS